MFWSKKACASRTFINHIYVMSNQFANWEPSFPIELGDYGKVDKDTGKFTKVGNIFNDGKTAVDETKLTTKTGSEDDLHNTVSLGALHTPFNIDPSANIPGLAEATIKSQYKFTRSCSAVLLMHKPITSKLEGNLDDVLRDGQYEHLRDMRLVTEVVTCPAYAMYLSVGRSETVRLVLRACVPIAGTVGTTAGGEIGGGWYSEGIAGVFRCGSQDSQPGQRFTTLYSTVTIDRRYHLKRELVAPDPATLEVDTWMNSVLPWNTLDENGEEMSDFVPREGSDSDSDSDDN